MSYNRQQNISGGNFMSASRINLTQNLITTNKGLESIAFTKLQSHAAPGALHNSGEISDPPKCHPGTRVDLLSVLITWALAALYKDPIRWLNGPVGAGKSAIMRSFAEMLVENGLLLASFFFFRTDARRNNAEYLISTIAYQLYITVPPLQPWIEHGIQSNPLIFSASLSVQVQTLVIDPLLHYFYDPQSTIITPFPRIILIDGLDECSGNGTQLEILQTLVQMVQVLPIPIAIVFASRPEHQIRGAFELGKFSEISSRITLDNGFNPDSDIQHYYDVEFEKIRRTHPMRRYLGAPWPSRDVMRTLVRNASGQFVYAVTVIKFVGSTRHNPAARLQIILGQIDRGRSKPFQQLDLLYTLIFLNVDPEVLPVMLRVLGIILTPPINGKRAYQSPKFVEMLLRFPVGHVRLLLLDLESLLTVREDREAINVHHTSLSDFLFDKSRAQGFFTDRGLVYADIASSCIKLLGFPQVVASQPLLGSYLRAHLRISLQKATPTCHLRLVITSCDIEQLINLPKSASPDTLTFLYLLGLKELAHRDAGILYQKKLRQVSQRLNLNLVEHWLKREHYFERSLLFVLLLALTHAHPVMAIRLINTMSFGGDQFISILPDIVCGGDGSWNEAFPTTDDWRSLAGVILEAIDRPIGLLRDGRSRQARTDLALHLVRGIHREALSQSSPYSDQLYKIFPILFDECLVRDDLTSAVRQARHVALKAGFYRECVGLAGTLDHYLQRAARSVHPAPDVLKIRSSGSGPR